MKMNSDQSNRQNKRILQTLFLAGAASSLLILASNTGWAYESYTAGCIECHEDFDGPTSLKGTVFPGDSKHVMHNGSSYMNTDCNLCHTSIGDDPLIGSSQGDGPGCTGCHNAEGLRAHHAINSVVDSNGDSCADCHPGDGVPPEENVISPPYYGTSGTEVDNPCNDVQSANLNENWSVGDFIGLDNDGDNLYDLADYSCGPLRMVEVVRDGNDMLIRWETAGGRTERVQAAVTLTNNYADIGSSVLIPGVGIVTQEVAEVNGALNEERFYRVRSIP